MTSSGLGARPAPWPGTAFVFPGQGSQTVGMGAELYKASPSCRAVFEEADGTLGFSLSRLCFEGPMEDLTRTANTQPALLAVSVAAVRLLFEAGIAPSFAAGHSLGEYSALVAAGVLSFADALRAVRLRGTAMQEAVPAGEGAMAAVIGLDPEEVEAACTEAAQGEVVAPANFNSPEQTVIAGAAAAVARTSAAASRRGAKRVVPLSVSAPFHCALMRPAEQRLAAHLEGIPFKDPLCPVVTNVDAAPIRTGAQARDALVRQVCAPVRWRESVVALSDLGTARFVEVGAGKVLCGLIRRIDRAAQTLSLEGPSDLQALLERHAQPLERA